MELNKIYCGDNVELCKQLDDSCIDLTITSPPYDNLRSYNGFTWDFELLAKELYRVTNDGGVVVWVVGDATIKGSETGSSFKQALYFKEIGFNLHDTMIWNKSFFVPRDPRIPRYYQSFEYMFVFSKGKPICNHIKEKCICAGKKSNPYSRDSTDKLRLDRKEKNKEHIIKNEKIKGNVWTYAPSQNKHPASFPEMLANDHIISWSNEGDLIFDPFMGSGTTAKMALKNNRNFIGFEISREYVDMANERIEEYKMNCVTYDSKPGLEQWF